MRENRRVAEVAAFTLANDQRIISISSISISSKNSSNNNSSNSSSSSR